jgi:hypothetical protein
MEGSRVKIKQGTHSGQYATIVSVMVITDWGDKIELAGDDYETIKDSDVRPNDGTSDGTSGRTP